MASLSFEATLKSLLDSLADVSVASVLQHHCKINRLKISLGCFW